MAKKNKFYKLTNARTNKPIYIVSDNLFVTYVEELTPYEPSLTLPSGASSGSVDIGGPFPSYIGNFDPAPPLARTRLVCSGDTYYLTEHISIVLALFEGKDAKAAKLLFERESNDEKSQST